MSLDADLEVVLFDHNVEHLGLDAWRQRHTHRHLAERLRPAVVREVGAPTRVGLCMRTRACTVGPDHGALGTAGYVHALCVGLCARVRMRARTFARPVARMHDRGWAWWCAQRTHIERFWQVLEPCAAVAVNKAVKDAVHKAVKDAVNKAVKVAVHGKRCPPSTVRSGEQ
eukprot:358595-Chlamydomonas_euryale.AAC.8